MRFQVPAARGRRAQSRIILADRLALTCDPISSQFDVTLHCVGGLNRLGCPFMKPRMTFGLLALISGSLVVFDAYGAPSSRPTLRAASELTASTELPDPLVMFGGERVETKKTRPKTRRPELESLFQHYMYGTMPPAPWKPRFDVERVDRSLFEGKATLKQVTIYLTKKESPAIHLLVLTPNARTKSAPVFLGLNFYGNYMVVNDPLVRPPSGWVPRGAPGSTNNHATEAGRGKQIDVWAVDQTIDRGYAFATFYNGDVEPDRPNAPEGIRAQFPNFDWGTIAAWAWGLQRAVDYLVTDGAVDPDRIAVVGHSRNGKAALVAGAFDERIALVVPLQAGCGGTAPSPGQIGESVKQINDSFPHWFNAEFKKFNEQPERLPFDQHCLVALCAPRPVLFSNATEDTWANPAGQFEMLRAADPVYRLLGAEGVGAQQIPETGKPLDSTLGYFIRPGKHSMTREDWKIFLDFADKHFSAIRP